MDKIKKLELLLSREEKDGVGHSSKCFELLFFMRNDEFGVSLYNSHEQSSDELEMNDCEYGNSLEEAIDKAIKRWSK